MSSPLPYGMSAVNCSTYPALQANPNISGIGVLVSFLATAYLTLLCCIASYILDLVQKKSHNDKHTSWMERMSFALDSIIVSFGDQQLVTGISIIIGALSQLEWGLSVYHFQQVGNLAWFSTMTHILTLTIMRKKMQSKADSVIRMLRIVLMGCLVVLLICAMVPLGYLSSAYGYISTVPDDRNDFAVPIPVEFPAWCLYHPSLEWRDDREGYPMRHEGAFGYNITYMVITITIIVYGYTSRVFLLFPRLLFRTTLRIRPGQPWVWIESKLDLVRTSYETRHGSSTRCAILLNTFLVVVYGLFYSLYILIISGKDVYGSKIWELSWLSMALIWGTIRIFHIRDVSNWNGGYIVNPAKVLPDVTSQQDVWGFGQVVALILLSLPFLSFAETYLTFAKDKPPLNQVRSTNTRNNQTALPSTLMPLPSITGLQENIRGKRWYPNLVVLWYLMSVMIGALGIFLLTVDGRIELSAVDSSGLSGAEGFVTTNVPVYPIGEFAEIISINLGLLWIFVLIMLLDWPFLSRKVVSAVLTFLWFGLLGSCTWIRGLCYRIKYHDSDWL